MLEVKAPKFVTIDGRKLAYDEVSPANPQGTVLLLTGLAAKRLSWYKQLDEFGKTYRTIALDHRDVGDSDLATEPYSIKDQADDAAAVLRALGVQKAHVVGISMGGFIAQELALRYPGLVDKLVLVSTHAGSNLYTPPGPEMFAMLQDRGSQEVGELAVRNYTQIMAPGYAKSHPEEMDRVAFNARYRPLVPEGYFRQLQACLAHNTSDRLSQLKAPTLVIHGDFDPLVPVKNGQALAANIPGATLILYSNTGHIPVIERAEDFNRDVLEFLRKD